MLQNLVSPKAGSLVHYSKFANVKAAKNAHLTALQVERQAHVSLRTCLNVKTAAAAATGSRKQHLNMPTQVYILTPFLGELLCTCKSH